MKKSISSQGTAQSSAAQAASDDMPEVFVIAEGIFYLTACAEEDLDGHTVEAAVRRQRTAGTSNGWRLSDEPTFSGGQTNPCVCDQVATRKHWLFAC